MNVELAGKILQVLFEAVQMGIQYGPQILEDLKRLWSLAVSGTTLTPEQQLDADTVFEAAHQEFQAQIAKNLAAEG